MKEEWKEITRKKTMNYKSKTVIAISNKGRMKHLDGTITVASYRKAIRIDMKLVRVYRFIAETFIPKTKEDIELNRNFIDHITHKPINMNINDVRNLRWCTNAENQQFEEHRLNLANSKKGKPNYKLREFLKKNKRTPWNKGMSGTEYTSHYKNGVRNSIRAKVG